MYRKINDNILYNTAEAIRTKLGTNDFMHPHEFASKIMSIASVNIQSKTISANGVYSAPSGVNGFNPVMVNVPNTFSEADSGKVVSGASLISQSVMSVSQNSIYDTTFINEMTVDVAGGGGIDTSDATLESGSQMLSGYTAYARGSKYTGTIPMYNGSINSGSGSVPSYDYYSGSYTIVPSTVSQAFPTAGKIMSENLQVEAYSAGSIPDTYSGSYVITPSMVSQAFPTAGKLMSQDLTVEAYSLDYYSDSYMIAPSTELVTVLTSGKTLLSDLQIAAYNPSERAYQGSYTIAPSTTQQVFSTSGKVMLSDLTVLPVSEVYMDGDSLKMHFSSSEIEFRASEHALIIDDSAFVNNPYLLGVRFDYAEEIGGEAFSGCSDLLRAYFSRCAYIGDCAFEGCVMLSDVYVANASYVGFSAFKGCESLPNIGFRNVSTIAPYAFENCTNLSEVNIYNESSVAKIYSTVFNGTPFSLNDSSYAKVYVPVSMVSQYVADSVWSNFSNCIVGFS